MRRRGSIPLLAGIEALSTRGWVGKEGVWVDGE